MANSRDALDRDADKNRRQVSRCERDRMSWLNHPGVSSDDVVTVGPEHSTMFALIFPKVAGNTCNSVDSIQFYPGADNQGPSTSLTLPSDVTECGVPRVLPFLPSDGDGDLTLASDALKNIATTPSDTSGTVSPDDTAGYWYGMDSYSNEGPCESGGVYYVPKPTCSAGYAGRLGYYIGERGFWKKWKCDSSIGLLWRTTYANAATSNYNSGNGLGLGVYWMAAGPGREPNYSSTDTAKANSWGQSQAARVVSETDTYSGNTASELATIFMDIEASYSSGLDDNGWNSHWTQTCGGSGASSVPVDIDFATYQGFRAEIWNNSAYFIGVYSAGGSGTSSWGYIMGSHNLSDTMEWTFENETCQGTPNYCDFPSLPSGFSDNYDSANWFASAPSNCHVVWQWFGGSNDLNVNWESDFDQLSHGNLYSCQ